MQFSPGKIARWLRAYRDWKAELEAEIGAAGRATADAGSSMQASRRSDPTAQAASRDSELAERCRTVEGWLRLLTPLERLAADYWLADDEGAITKVAEAMGVEARRARNVVRSIPLLIWGHLYDPPVDVNAVSS